MDQFTSPQIGLALRRLRKKHNLTQKDLANGICSQAEISKIESGTHSPTVDLLFALSRRLQVPITVFLDHTEQQTSMRLIDDSFLSRFRNKDFNAIFNETKTFIESSSNNIELSLLYKYYFHLCAYRLNKTDFRTCIIELQNLSDKYSTIYYSPDMIVRIKAAIANIYYENKSYKHSLRVYEEILRLNFDNDEMILNKIRIQYNFSKILIELKKPETALTYVNDGIKQSIKFKDMSLLGQLLFQKGACLELINSSFKSTSEVYQKAYLLFELLDMTEYKQIMLEKKLHYLKIL
ncbi:helix-turn-helix domain-containing protein [Exiguobacterium sp. K1]|uniref:helix-turn-helix domain-containing protein n=1 Tax=Exiguobacterium sp. K1 TaxID=2980105 RepID=UPI00299E0D66|nr:helix-turn-helix domain-containing protein [Exiguobacterium sp. K1]MDX1259460.1 helix-turn-helix transcriptional regulator [Exiguobacterium sp. K1]